MCLVFIERRKTWVQIATVFVSQLLKKLKMMMTVMIIIIIILAIVIILAWGWQFSSCACYPSSWFVLMNAESITMQRLCIRRRAFNKTYSYTYSLICTVNGPVSALSAYAIFKLLRWVLMRNVGVYEKVDSFSLHLAIHQVPSIGHQFIVICPKQTV